MLASPKIAVRGRLTACLGRQVTFSGAVYKGNFIKVSQEGRGRMERAMKR